jgi:hypothetical protein
MTSSEVITLTHPEDWERWLKQVRAETHPDIWPHIDPNNDDLPEGVEELLDKPKRPKLGDYKADATTYAELSSTQRTAYNTARKYYETDFKAYDKEQERLQVVRRYISTHVSPQKQILLNPNDSAYGWLHTLKKNTEPTNNYMIRRVQQQYAESLKGLKANKVNQWIDQWEHAMAMTIMHKPAIVENGVWLIDLARALRPLSEAYFVSYNQQANKKERSDPSTYVEVAMELREALGYTAKKASTIARGSTFNADFGGEEPPSDAEDAKGKGRSRGRKRGGTTSVEKEASATKKTTQCQACGFKGHTLQDCWILFEDKRPENYKSTKASEARAKKVKEKVANDKDLTAEVERIRSQEKTMDEA